MAGELVAWMAGFFTRVPDRDIEGERGGRAWRAFQYIDGGIWYAYDDEDYTLVSKYKCSACDGRRSRPPCDQLRVFGRCADKGLNWECSACGAGKGCTICDGRGFVFNPVKIRRG